MSEVLSVLGGFTAPMSIGTTPQSMLWMFPLLLSVALIYKATKLRVMFMKRFFREVALLFATLSVFMVLAAVGLNILVWFLTT